MLVTIIVDASFCPTTKVAGYGYWIASNRGKLPGGGIIHANTPNSTVAELYAVANGLHIALFSGIAEPQDSIIIQTDCQTVLDVLTGVGKASSKEMKLGLYAVTRIIEANHLLVEYRHVPGHTNGETPRRAANNHCDSRARSFMRKARGEY